MNKFAILIVDDEQDIRNIFRTLFGSKPQYKLVTAGTVDEALKIIEEHFLHVAFIDMQLGTDLKGGLKIAKMLADNRPSCRSYLLTQHPGTYADQLFALLDPLRPQIQGALQKQDYTRTWESIVDSIAARWLSRPIHVEGADLVFRSLQEKLKSYNQPPVDLTCEEVDFVVSRILGQETRIDLPITDETEPQKRSAFELRQIALSLMTGGRSSSVVAMGRPSTSRGDLGIWSVIKFSPRGDAIEEYERYSRFVRFILSLDYRVELLGFSDADTIGAMCYSFAGKSPSEIVSLDSLIHQESNRALEVIRRLFAVDSHFWYNLRGPEIEIGHFFSRAYWFKVNEILTQINRFVEEIANNQREYQRRGDDLLVPGDRILNPAPAVSHPLAHARLQTAIIHGDLNSNNVIVSDDDRVILIDYRHTGYGPRALDFAALECSVRLALAGKEGEFERIASIHRLEGEVWNQVWMEDAATVKANTSKPFWAVLSVELGSHARNNFLDLEPKEYAITCLFWALRVFRVRGLQEGPKFRLLIWMSQLTKVLSDSKTANIST